MNGLFENPVVQAALSRSPGPLGGQRRWRSSPVLHTLAIGIGFALLILVPMAVGICGCTMFAIASVAMILASSLAVGNSAFGALTVEREKKTLDSLRLTQLSPHEVLFAKLLPEFGTLALVIGATAPAVVIAGLWGHQHLMVVVGAVGIALLAGVFVSVTALFMSSLFATTSQAVVSGWIVKGVWLLLTPMLDLVAGAVFVQNVSPPVFTSLNPLAAFGVLAVPEAALESRQWLPYLYPFVTVGVTLLLWIVTARRFASGMVNNGGLRDKQVHPVYHKGFGPAWLTRQIPLLRDNPSFLRELAAQIRAGAGRWPGYMVFLVLFLAPTFYARSWTLNDMRLQHVERSARDVNVVGDNLNGAGGVLSRSSDPHESSAYKSGVLMHSYNTDIVLEGHTDCGCMRLALFQWAGVALPKDSLRFYRREYSQSDGDPSQRPQVVQVDKPDPSAATALGFTDTPRDTQDLSEENRNAANSSSLHVGIAGAIALLLLYLSIRFSAFLATAVTGERSRRTWEDLALTGISVREAMSGKILGAILLPAMQMTLVFPVLGIFVMSGNLQVYDIVALYVYAIALSVAAAMLGLWASSRTPTSHDAHLRALCMVFGAFFLLPLMMPGLQLVLIPLAVLGALLSSKKTSSVLAWGCIAAALGIAPQALSPLTAAISFMPSLTASNSFLHLLGVAPATPAEALINLCCGLLLMVSLSVVLWNSAIGRLTHAHDGETLSADHVEPGFGTA